MTEELKANRKWEAKIPIKQNMILLADKLEDTLETLATEEDISEIKTWLELVEQRRNEEIKRSIMLH